MVLVEAKNMTESLINRGCGEVRSIEQGTSERLEFGKVRSKIWINSRTLLEKCYQGYELWKLALSYFLNLANNRFSKFLLNTTYLKNP